MIHWKRSREVKVYKEVIVRLSVYHWNSVTDAGSHGYLCGYVKISFGLTVEKQFPL